MKTLKELCPVLILGSALLWAPVPFALGQTPAALSLQASNNTVQLTITGTAGAPCALQYDTNLSQPGNWTTFSNLTLPSSPYVVMFTNPVPTGGFFRAVTIAPTNMAFIPAGTFVMGSPSSEIQRLSDEVQHTVTLTYGFFMGKYLVTQGDYQALIGVNPSFFTPVNVFPLDLNLPVEQVTWTNAANYCAQLTLAAQNAGRLPPGWSYRLPTEAEWEYACRAGTTTAFYLGSELLSGEENFDGMHEYASTTGTFENPSGVWLDVTSDVGNYPANPWGLYDMGGNVFEWCMDWYAAYPNGSVTNQMVTDPASGQRVARSASFALDGFQCRSAQRFEFAPTNENEYTGFRIVLAPNLP